MRARQRMRVMFIDQGATVTPEPVEPEVWREVTAQYVVRGDLGGDGPVIMDEGRPVQTSFRALRDVEQRGSVLHPLVMSSTKTTFDDEEVLAHGFTSMRCQPRPHLASTFG